MHDHDLAQIVIETVGALVVVLDRDARIQRWNTACEAATGYDRDEVLGRPLWFLVPPEERAGSRRCSRGSSRATSRTATGTTGSRRTAPSGSSPGRTPPSSTTAARSAS